MDHKYMKKDRGQRYVIPAPPAFQTNHINSDPYTHIPNSWISNISSISKISNYLNIYAYLDNMIDKFDKYNAGRFFVQKQTTPAPFLRIEQGRNSELGEIL